MSGARVRGAALASLLAVGVAGGACAVRATAAPRPSTDSAAVRQAVVAQYDSMARAIEARDVDRVLRVFSPLDTAAEDGRAWWVDAFARARVDRMTIALDSLAVRGDTARVVYVEHSLLTLDPAGAARRADVTNHEVAWWVRAADGRWLHQAFVRNRLPRRVVDGVERPARHDDSLNVAVAREERRRRAWPGDAEYAAARPDADAAELLRLEASLGSADLPPGAATAAWLDSTLDAEFVLTGASGRRLDRAATIARWSSPDPASQLVASALSDVRLVIAGDAAYVTAMSTETERRASGDTTFRLRVTDVWARSGGRWRAIASHLGRVTVPDDPPPHAPVVLRVAVDAGDSGDSAALVAAERGVPGLSHSAKVARFDSTIVADFLSTRMNGTTSGKAATIARWAPEPRAGAIPVGDYSVVSDVRVRTLGGLAVVRLVDTQYDTAGRVQLVAHTTDVWRKEGGRWRLAALQASRASAAVGASDDSAAVVAAEWAMVRASAAGDAAALDTLIDSAFVGTVRSGRSFGKRAAIRRWAAPDTSGERSVLEHIVVRPFDDGAFVEMVDAQIARDGRRLRASRAVDLWVRRGPRWLLAAGHALPESVPDDAAAIAAARAARARWNAAVAARDTAAVRALVGDSVAQASHVFRTVGGDAYVALMARIIARRPDLELRYEPARVEAAGTAAFETGRWVERWRERGEPTELAGEYHAIWKNEGGRWTIAAELFAPTSCSGVSYCR